MTTEEILYLRQKAATKSLMRSNHILQKLEKLARAGMREWQQLLAEITPGIVG